VTCQSFFYLNFFFLNWNTCGRR